MWRSSERYVALTSEWSRLHHRNVGDIEALKMLSGCLEKINYRTSNYSGICSEWQRRGAVNPLVQAFVGSSPTIPTIFIREAFRGVPVKIPFESGEHLCLLKLSMIRFLLCFSSEQHWLEVLLYGEEMLHPFLWLDLLHIRIRQLLIVA